MLVLYYRHNGSFDHQKPHPSYFRSRLAAGVNHNHDRRQDEKRDATHWYVLTTHQHLVGRFIEGSCGLENAVYPPELYNAPQRQEQKGRSPRQDRGVLWKTITSSTTAQTNIKTGDDREWNRGPWSSSTETQSSVHPGHDSMTGPQKRTG